MKDYFELECAIESWAEEKGIFEKGTPMSQALKIQEELTELLVAINNNDKDAIADALGDIMVTLLIQAKMQNMELEACTNLAYDIISKRTGKMVDGQFVKNGL